MRKARMTAKQYNAFIASKKAKTGSGAKPPKRSNTIPPERPGQDMFTLLAKKILNLEPVKEHRFHPIRRWRFDYAFTAQKIAVEVEGGIWMKGGGAHSRPANIVRDMEKYNEAMVLGWRIIRVQPADLCKSATFHLIGQYLR